MSPAGADDSDTSAAEAAVLALREAGVEQRRARLREVESRLDGEEWERRRWVRELHDDTLQELAAVHVLLAGAAAAPPGDAPGRERAIGDAARMVGQQIQTLRRLISRMRPLALDSLGLGTAPEDLARHAQAGTTEIEVYVDSMPRMPAETETYIYRIAQEALTNAVRHAGARRITIEAQPQAQIVTVTVRDDGHGLPSSGFVAGHGLLGMRERADILGATLEIATPAAGGTVVRLRVPRRRPEP